MKIYSIYDRVGGVYNQPFGSVSVGTAVRQFNYLMQNSPMVSADCQLFFIGDFDEDTGVFVPAGEKPDFICNYNSEAN